MGHGTVKIFLNAFGALRSFAIVYSASLYCIGELHVA